MNVDEQLRTHAPDEAAMRTESQRLRDTVLANLAATDEHTYLRALPRVTRRRVITRVAVMAAVLGVVGTGISFAFDGAAPASAAQQRFASAAPAPAYDTYGAFSSGKTVYIGNHSVTFDEKIKAMYYTSEGVLVRMGKVDYTDAAGPSHYSLIRPDGTYSSIDLRMGDRVVATDPKSPNVAYAEPNGKQWSFVVINLVTAKEVARTTVDGVFTWGGWEAPPVTMAGDRMWALFDGGWMEYDWSVGTTRMIPGTKNAPLEAAHGVYAVYNDVDQLDWKVRDFVTGELLRTVPISQIPNAGTFSPDGRYLRLNGDWGATDEAGNWVELPGPSSFMSIDSGKVVKIPGRNVYGWTPGGNTLTVDAERDRLTVCDPGTGTCDRIDLPIKGTGKVKLGGLSYES